MAILKCGTCGGDWNYFLIGSNLNKHTKCGPPYIKCEHCETPNETPYKMYSEMGHFQKIYFWWIIIFETILFAGGGGFLAYAMFFVWDLGGVNYLFGVGGIASSFYTLYKTSKIPMKIKELEMEVDKNKGYVWSNFFK